MPDETRSNKSWIIYCIMFLAIIVFAVLYGVERIRHYDAKEASELKSCLKELETCDFELLTVDRKLNNTANQRDLCLKNGTNVTSQFAVIHLPPNQNERDEPLVPSNNKNYKYYITSSAQTAQTKNYVLLVLIHSFLPIWMLY